MSSVLAPAEVACGLAGDAIGSADSRTNTDTTTDTTGSDPDGDLEEWIPRHHPPPPNPYRARQLARQRHSPEGRRLRTHYAHLATRATRTRLSFGAAAARFLQAEGPRWMGYSSLRDYVRGRLGIPWATFHTYRRVAQLTLDFPEIRAAALQPGGPALSVLDVVARAHPSLDPVRSLPSLARMTVQEVRAWCDARMQVHDCEPPTTSTSDPVYHRVSFRVPSSVALYIEETLDLAQSLLGHDAREDQQVAAVVAEASTEIPMTVSPAEALAHLHLPSLHELQHPRPAGGRELSAVPESSSTTECASSAQHPPCAPGPETSLIQVPQAPAPQAPAPPTRPGSHRRVALVLDRFLLRQARRLRQTDLGLEDALLHALESYDHHQCGFATFTDFAHQVMDIAPRTTWDRIRRARRRRAQDPLAIAHATGRITAVQADLLHRLHRLPVPYHRLEPWIHHAETITTRRLRQSVAWARRQILQHGLAWQRAGSPPPTDAQLRTSNRPLDEIAADADGPDLDPARAEPQATVHWTLTPETLIDLALLMTSFQQAHWRQTCRTAPTWWTLLAVFWHARQAWAPLVEANRTDRQRQRILARDRYRCVFPDCSLRQGVEVHHIVYRGQQGEDEDDNLVTLCGFHHRLGEHEHTVRIRGQATEGGDSLRWELGLDLHGRPRLVYQGEHLVLDALQRSTTGSAHVYNEHGNIHRNRRAPSGHRTNVLPRPGFQPHDKAQP